MWRQVSLTLTWNPRSVLHITRNHYLAHSLPIPQGPIGIVFNFAAQTRKTSLPQASGAVEHALWF